MLPTSTKKEAPPHAGKAIRISHDDMIELHPHGRTLLDQHDHILHTLGAENAGLEPFYMEATQGARIGWLPHGDTRTPEDLELTACAIEAGRAAHEKCWPHELIKGIMEHINSTSEEIDKQEIFPGGLGDPGLGGGSLLGGGKFQ